MPRAVLGPGNRAVNKTDKIPCPCGADKPVEWSSPALAVTNPRAPGPGQLVQGCSRKAERSDWWGFRGANPETKRPCPRGPRIAPERLRTLELSELSNRMEKGVTLPDHMADDIMGTQHWLTWFSLFLFDSVSVLCVPATSPGHTNNSLTGLWGGLGPRP